MLRSVIGLVLLLGPAAGLSRAQYVRIKVDLNDFNPGKYTPMNPAGAGGEGGGPGGLGGFPGPGPGAMPGPMPGPGAEGGDGTGVPMVPDPPVWVEAHIAVNSVVPTQQFMLLDHKWGKSVIPSDVAWPKDPRVLPGVSAKYKFLAKAASQGGYTADEYLNLARWALQHGAPAEMHKKMKELREKEPDNKILAVFDKVDKQLKQAPGRDDPTAAEIQAQLSRSGYKSAASDGGHYTLLTGMPTSEPAVKNRLDNLERTFTSFYYWFALQGKEVPIPDYRLVVVLEQSAKEYKRRHESYTNAPLTDDGFLERRHNVMFLSDQPIDEGFRLLIEKTSTQMHNLPGWKRENVLKQGYQAVDPVLQTMVLLEKALQEEAEAAETSHEGIKQLLAANGLLPRNVVSGEWVRYGIASFFHTPRLAFFPQVGLADWANLANFDYYRKTKKLPKEASADELLKVVTDGYFHDARDAYRDLELADKKTPEVEKEAAEAVEMARATSWSLTYYLMEKKSDGLFQYLAELRDLPRDVEYRPEVLAGCFARAFELGADPRAQAEDLAESWYRFTDGFDRDIQMFEEIMVQDRITRDEEAKKKKTQPTMPPGGYPGPGSSGTNP